MVSLKNVVQQTGQLVGLDVFKHKPGWQWSHTVESYYPVSPRPRWGYGQPLQQQINDILNRHRNEFVELLRSMETANFITRKVPDETSDPSLPMWNNDFFNGLDAAALIGMLYVRRPKQYLEIGSGNSTKFARLAIKEGGLSTKLTSVDPQPRAEIDVLCDRVIRKPFEECSEELLHDIASGDIVFFDGSHRTFANSDVNVFFFEFLPKLPRGVIVHIHDIFLPADYPPEWNNRLYSEQYILAAMMMGQVNFFKPLLPNFFIDLDPELKAVAATLYPPQSVNVFANSFWIETV